MDKEIFFNIKIDILEEKKCQIEIHLCEAIHCCHSVEVIIKRCNGQKNINHFQVYGESNLLMKWIKRSRQILNTYLKTLGDQVNAIANLFEVISFTYAFIGSSAVKRKAPKI